MSTSKRLFSLDAFRGLTIALMILVNTPGSWSYVYGPLQHADWHGCTPTDLVFPFFLFIVGVSMWFSFKKNHHETQANIYWKVWKRVVVIFTIGVLLNLFPFYDVVLGEERILGVLQRIALSFGGASMLCLLLSSKRILLAVSVGILFFYWWILWYFGGAFPYGLEENAVRKVDLFLLGEAHLWQGKGLAFDPEGLLSTIPACISVVLGFFAGQLIEKAKETENLFPLWTWGLVGILLGLLWGQFVPINKALWTSSYVLYTAGIALIGLGILIGVIDFKGYKKWANPLIVFGMNSLFAYILSIIWVKLLFVIKADGLNGYDWLYQTVFVPIAGNWNGSLLFAITHIVFFWSILWILYQKRIFIKV